MAIFKARATQNFTTLDNTTIQDKSLTFEASGLLHFMLSLPEDWAIKKSWLEEQKLRCGRDKLTRMLNELQEQGYVVKRTVHGKDGKITGIDWLVYPTPRRHMIETENVINQTTEKPSDGKPAPTKETDIQNKQERSLMAQVPKFVKDGYSADFLELWALKPEREGSNPKRAAYKAYQASLKRGNSHREIRSGLLRYRNYCIASGKVNTEFVMRMVRFFGPEDEYKHHWSVKDEQPTITNISNNRKQFYDKRSRD